MYGSGTFFLALGLSMDAFAAAVCQGLAADRLTPGRMAWVGLWFGGAQGVMPLLGWLLGIRFAAGLTAVDHWVAFGLLTALGVNMLWEIHRGAPPCGGSFSVRTMAPLALATSVDALAAGLTFAALGVDPVCRSVCVALVTGGGSVIGLILGHRFGLRWRSRAQAAGGVLLLLMGVKILWEHTRFYWLSWLG